MILTTTIAVILLITVFFNVSNAEQIQEASILIVADPFYVRLIGNFDPRVDDVYFISALQITFDEYYEAQQYNDTLHGFDIAAIFINEGTRYEFQQTQAANDQSVTMIRSWCEIQSTFSVPVDLDSSKFNTDIATQFVKDFFSIEHSTELVSRLSKTSNVTLHAIEAFTASSEIVRTELGAYMIDIRTDTSSPKSKALKVLAIISGTIICLSVVVLLLSTLLRRYKVKKNDDDDDRLGIKKREKDETKIITIPSVDATSTSILDQTFSDMEEENYDDGDDAVNERKHEQIIETLKKNDPPIVSSDSFMIQDDDVDDDDNETVVTRNRVSPTASQHNSPLSASSTSNASPVWSMFSGTSTDPTMSPYSTEEVLKKRYRWHDSDADDDVDINQLLSLPEEPRSPSASSYEIELIAESDSTGSSTSHDS